MRTYVIQKIKNKKILNLCLLLGIVLMIAVCSCTPMFERGSLDKLLQRKLEEKMVEENAYPVSLYRIYVDKSKEMKYQTIKDSIMKYKNTWDEYIDIPSVNFQYIIRLSAEKANHSFGTNTEWINIGCIPGMEEHIDILSGTLEGDESGIYPCYMTERTMDVCNYMEGDILTLDGMQDASGKPLKLKVMAIIKEKNDGSYFWHKHIMEEDKLLLVPEYAMEDMIDNYYHSDVYYEMNELYDYRSINSSNVDDLKYYIEEFHKQDANIKDSVLQLFEEYAADKSFVSTICWVLELPIIMLMFAFIYMVVSQILSMESGEIAMLTSRGFSRLQVMGLYLRQSGILAAIGCVLGLPLGYLLCKLAASTDGFLDFAIKDVSIYHARWMMIPYALGAAVICMIFITIPVAFYAKDTIIQRRTRKNTKANTKVIRQLAFNIGMLGISLYLLYNFNARRGDLSIKVLTGGRLDPIMFLNLTFFLFACGLLGLQILHCVVRLVYWLGRRRWKPNTYASLLQIIRGGSKSQFIAVFLIFTVSMGIVDANVAGTINTNNEERTAYNIGVDFILNEEWIPKSYKDSQQRKTVRYYVEPDYQRYSDLLSDKVDNMTRVVRDKDVKVSASGATATGCMMMAINTKEFGETADLMDGLNDTHWYNLLNELAVNGTGILVSENLAQMLNISVGDTIKYTRTSELSSSEKSEATAVGIVCGIFKAWPSYEQYSYGYNEAGEYVMNQNYGIVVNYANEKNVFGDTPYEIWMRLKPGVGTQDILNTVEEAGITVTSSKSREDTIVALRNSSVIQITNGLFTLSFLISLVLCTIGFLIYWITSIKQRELLFGIYRAMGMSFKEVNGMLMLEQILSSLLAGILGGVSGMLASLLHTGVLSIVYLPRRHNIALHTVIDGLNLARFMVVLCVMIVVCLVVMRNQIKKLNMIQAIKMGED